MALEIAATFGFSASGATREANTIKLSVISINRVETALTSGVTATLIMVKICSGRVDTPRPAAKKRDHEIVNRKGEAHQRARSHCGHVQRQVRPTGTDQASIGKNGLRPVEFAQCWRRFRTGPARPEPNTKHGARGSRQPSNGDGDGVAGRSVAAAGSR